MWRSSYARRRSSGRCALANWSNVRVGTRRPRKDTRTDLPSTAAASHVLFSTIASVSGSRPVRPKRGQSGTNVTRVYGLALAVPATLAVTGVTLGGSARDKLSCHVCLYFLAPSHRSTSNRVEKMDVSFAPYPLRPPVTRFSESSKFDPASRWPNTSSGTRQPSVGWGSTGTLAPSLYTLIAPSSDTSTFRVAIEGSRALLSMALTRISSKILHRAGRWTVSRSSKANAGPTGGAAPSVLSAGAISHIASETGSTDPTYVSGRRSTCSICVSFAYFSAIMLLQNGHDGHIYHLSLRRRRVDAVRQVNRRVTGNGKVGDVGHGARWVGLEVHHGA